MITKEDTSIDNEYMWSTRDQKWNLMRMGNYNKRKLKTKQHTILTSVLKTKQQSMLGVKKTKHVLVCSWKLKEIEKL